MNKDLMFKPMDTLDDIFAYCNDEKEIKRLEKFFTKRRRQVAELICCGFSNKEIGKKLTISRSTAQTHVSEIITKLDAKSKAGAAVKYAIMFKDNKEII